MQNIATDSNSNNQQENETKHMAPIQYQQAPPPSIFMQDPTKNPFLLSELGISPKSIDIVNSIDDLRPVPPNIVIGKCVSSFSFTSYGGDELASRQTLQKKNAYVMSLGMYLQLHKEGKKSLLKPNSVKFKSVYKPYMGQDLHGKRLLVCRTAGFGDMLFSQPMLRFLKKEYPTCSITFCANKKYWPLFSMWPEGIVDNLLPVPFEYKELVSHHYHVIFEGVIERTIQARRTNCYMLYSEWMGLGERIPEEDLVPVMELTKSHKEYAQEILQTESLGPGSFVVVQMRASSILRTPRPSFWVPVFRGIWELLGSDTKIVITDSPEQASSISTFIGAFFDSSEKDRIVNLAPRCKSITTAFCIVPFARACVSVDSVMSHVAPAFGIPTVGVFGSFAGFTRCSTYKKTDWVEPPQGACRFCFMHGYSPCPKTKDGFPICFDSIDTNKIIESLRGLLLDTGEEGEGEITGQEISINKKEDPKNSNE